MSDKHPSSTRQVLKAAVLAVSSAMTPMVAHADILADPCPTGVAVPPGQKLARTFYASGVQIYTCQESPAASGTYAWVNTAAADLFKPGEKQAIGTHYFDPGPTWEVNGSVVKGARVCAVNSPAESPSGALAGASITWVLLSATPPTEGVFQEVSYIQRINTIAGKRYPDYACDATVAGDATRNLLRMPYATNYLFYKPR